MSIERRTEPRVQTSVSAEVNTGVETFTTRARNLSMGGIGLYMSRALEPRTNVALSVFLVEDGVEDATSVPLEVHCQVVWVSAVRPGRWEAGLRFFDLDPQQELLLRRFIGRLPEATPAPRA